MTVRNFREKISTEPGLQAEGVLAPPQMRTVARIIMTAAVGAGFTAACRPSIPNQVLTKPAPAAAPEPAAARPLAGPWAYRPSTQLQAFVVDQRAVIAVRTDTATRTDSLATHAAVSFTTTASGAVGGNLTAYTVQAATPPGVTMPFPFRGDFSASGSSFQLITPRDAQACATSAPGIVQSLRDLWFRAPDTLRVGAVWSDSAAYSVCRDGIPLRASSRRTFRVSGVTERDGRAVLTITRTARSALEGSGSQFGEAIALSGSGGGELVYEFDPLAGAILSASGTSQLDFLLRSRLRTQSVHQTVETRIARN